MVRTWCGLEEKMETGYQPRYVAYAKAHGKTPDEMMEHDNWHQSGGCMLSYIFWITAHWREWDALTKHVGPHSDADCAKFDEWLASL